MKRAIMGLVLVVVFSLVFLLGRQFPADRYRVLAGVGCGIFLHGAGAGRACGALPPKTAAGGNPIGHPFAPTVDESGLPCFGR